jgi:hypothetical protein
MNVQTSKTRISANAANDAAAVMTDPWAFFGNSATELHSVSRKDAEALQLACMNVLLEKRRGEISTLAKFADAQNIHKIEKLDDMAPLLFEHKVYKSYPVSLLAKQRYDQLNTWLSRLTPYKISDIDVSKCKSIEEWLTTLRDNSPLDVACSSGTTGTMSFFPKTKHDYTLSVRGHRTQLVQKFGTPPTRSDLEDKLHALIPLCKDGHSSSSRFVHYFGKVFGLGDESYIHYAFQYKLSPDLMWLAARLRAAAARGDTSRVDVPDHLLARRDELEKQNREAGEQRVSFIKNVVAELKGKKVFAMSTTPMFLEVAQKGLAEGIKGAFASGSVLMGGGGAKGMVMPDNYKEICCEFFGADRMITGYGMTEMNTMVSSCEHDHFHMPPWVTIFVLDLDTGMPKPRSGVQSGRAAFFDPTHDGTWSGIITGDHITVDWDKACPCGRKTPIIHSTISRVSELQGGDDKISCAAQPGAQAEAMAYLTAIDS